jgi:hypothetical protein
VPRPRLPSADKGDGDPSAFLNIPYDTEFVGLYLAYIAGLAAFGVRPTASLEIPGGERRLDRIFTLIQSCIYSFHDLSRVQLDEHRPLTPRFNMPFELGLTVAWEKLNPGRHRWFVMESKNRRVLKSLSDLAGTDVQIHDGNVKGVLRELANSLVWTGKQPTVPEMQAIYRGLQQQLPAIQSRAGGGSAYGARTFYELRVLARALAREQTLLS